MQKELSVRYVVINESAWAPVIKKSFIPLINFALKLVIFILYCSSIGLVSN
jgi:hypothetical protein